MGQDPTRKKAYLAVIFLMILWGIDYAAIKIVQGSLSTLTLMFIRYLLGFFVISFIMLLNPRRVKLRARHIPMMILCAFLGEIFYYYCEYSALRYMPAALVTVILTFTPVVSAVMDRIIHKRKLSAVAITAMVICVLGVGLIIGLDMDEIRAGRLIGYIFCFCAVLLWASYNFAIEKLEGDFDSVSLTFYQVVLVLILLAPVGIHQFPGFEVFNDHIIPIAILFSGFLCEGIGFLIYIAGLRALGPTDMVTLNNLLPVSTAVFGWILLGEHLTPMQVFGMAVVIIASFVVVRNTEDKEIRP